MKRAAVLSAALLAYVVLTASCGGGDDEDPPSCQQGVGAYYDAGCYFEDVNGTPFTENEIVSLCRQTLAYPECESELNAWLICLESVDSATCDCSVEQERLINC